MNALVEALKDFIARDILFVIGGASLMLSFCMLIGIPIPSNPSLYAVLFGVGVAYGIGYVIQDGISLIGLTTTGTVKRPGSLIRVLYRRLTGSEWKKIETDEEMKELGKAKKAFNDIANDNNRAQWHRTVVIKQIGTTLGSSWLLISILLLIARFILKDRANYLPDGLEPWHLLPMGIGGLIFSFVLIGLSWVKGAQQSQFFLDVFSEHKKKPEPKVKRSFLPRGSARLICRVRRG